MSEKKEIRIPRLWVYVSAFVTGVIVTMAFGMVFGFESAVTFLTTALIYGVLFICSYNVFDKIDKQPYRLTWKYWTLIGLIVLSDFLFLFLAKAPTKAAGQFRAGLFVAALVATICFAYYTYRPEQIEIFSKIKEASKMEIVKFLEEHVGESNEALAEGILGVMFAPKKKEETPEGEEANA